MLSRNKQAYQHRLHINYAHATNTYTELIHTHKRHTRSPHTFVQTLDTLISNALDVTAATCWTAAELLAQSNTQAVTLSTGCEKYVAGARGEGRKGERGRTAERGERRQRKRGGRESDSNVSRSLDELFGGGISTGELVELVGEPATGKSQVGHITNLSSLSVVHGFVVCCCCARCHCGCFRCSCLMFLFWPIFRFAYTVNKLQNATPGLLHVQCNRCDSVQCCLHWHQQLLQPQPRDGSTHTANAATGWSGVFVSVCVFFEGYFVCCCSGIVDVVIFIVSVLFVQLLPSVFLSFFLFRFISFHCNLPVSLMLCPFFLNCRWVKRNRTQWPKQCCVTSCATRHSTFSHLSTF